MDAVKVAEGFDGRVWCARCMSQAQRVARVRAEYEADPHIGKRCAGCARTLVTIVAEQGYGVPGVIGWVNMDDAMDRLSINGVRTIPGDSVRLWPPAKPEN